MKSDIIRSITSARRVFAAGKKRFNGAVGPEDYRAGLKLLKRAADLGEVTAHTWLGAAYDYGIGTRHDRSVALKHYRTAAEAGNANAQ